MNEFNEFNKFNINIFGKKYFAKNKLIKEQRILIENKYNILQIEKAKYYSISAKINLILN